MNKTIAAAIAGILVGFGGGQMIDVQPTTAVVEYVYYDLDSGRVVQPPVSTIGYAQDSISMDYLLHTYPLSTYVPDIYPNGDFDYDGVANIIDLNKFVRWAFLGDTLPIRPDF